MTENISIEELAALAAGDEDQTQVTEGGDFNNDPPRAGITVGRFVGYIELGMHDGGSYQGKKKPDADSVRMVFELLHPDHIIEYEKDGVTHRRGHLVQIVTKKSLNEKAKFKKLFDKMRYGRDNIKHFAQMLGDAYIMELFHNVVDKDGKKVTYVNLTNDAGEFVISAPWVLDPLTKKKQMVDVAERTVGLQLFLWDRPTQATWDSLFIDGTRDKKKPDGTVEKVSNNWLQERILSAKNFKGSALHQMLTGIAASDLPTSEPPAPAEEPPIPDSAEPQPDLSNPLAALGFK